MTHPAAVRAAAKLEDHFGVPENEFVEPDLAGIITREYLPLEEAARRVRELLGQALGANPGVRIDWAAEVASLDRAIREVCGC